MSAHAEIDDHSAAIRHAGLIGQAIFALLFALALAVLASAL